jgi:23S rRNA pseudouridine2605 synthase
MRLARYLALCGVASRRHAEGMVTSGRVFVDGKRVTDPARDVDQSNEVSVDGRSISPEPHEYHLLNKPRGVVATAHDPQGRRKVTDLVRSKARLYPVGRLDIDTRGLILLTNDGELANRLMHPRYEVEKTYSARVKGEVSDQALQELRSGVELDDGRTAPAKVTVVEREAGKTLLELVIHEGRNRQVRRMCEAVGHPVIELERTGYGLLNLGELTPGRSRELEPGEVEALKRAPGSARST